MWQSRNNSVRAGDGIKGSVDETQLSSSTGERRSLRSSVNMTDNVRRKSKDSSVGPNPTTAQSVVTEQPALYRGASGTVSEEIADCINALSVVLCWPLFSLLCPITRINEYERAVLFRFERLRSGGARGPGVAFVNPAIDSVVKVDMRVVCEDVLPQEILTNDAVSLRVDAVAFTRVSDAVSVVCRVEQAHLATIKSCESSVRHAVCRVTLKELMEKRQQINDEIRRLANAQTCKWGVVVEQVELKNIELPRDLVRAMSTEAETKRRAEARVLLSQGDEAAAVHLLKASDQLNTPESVTLRGLETIAAMSHKCAMTTVFAFPMPPMESFWGDGENSCKELWEFIFNNSRQSNSRQSTSL